MSEKLSRRAVLTALASTAATAAAAESLCNQLPHLEHIVSPKVGNASELLAVFIILVRRLAHLPLARMAATLCNVCGGAEPPGSRSAAFLWKSLLQTGGGLPIQAHLNAPAESASADSKFSQLTCPAGDIRAGLFFVTL